MAQGLNDWRKIEYRQEESGGGDDSGEEDDDDAVLLEQANEVADHISPGDFGTLDAGSDKAAAGRGELRYYVVKFSSEAYTLDAPMDVAPYGTLDAGLRVVDFEYLDPAYGKDESIYLYVPNATGEHTVPVDIVLQAGFDLPVFALPQRGAAKQQREAVKAGARELSTAVRAATLAELRQRGNYD